MPKAKLFKTGGSQAVRLPAEFRFEGDEVGIRRDAVTGDVVLSKPTASWDEYFTNLSTLKEAEGFQNYNSKKNRPDNFLLYQS